MNTLRRNRSTNDTPSIEMTSILLSTLPSTRPPINNNNSDQPPTHYLNPPAPSEPQPYAPQRHTQNSVGFLSYHGLGPFIEARSAVVSIYTCLIVYAIQFVIITVILTIAAKTNSVTNPSLNEWAACPKPLGIWGALWVARTTCSSALAYWGWRLGGRGSERASDRRPYSPRELELATPPVTLRGAEQRLSAILSDMSPLAPELVLFARLTVLSNLCGLGWFLAAQAMVFTSTNTCRQSSPHLYWLIFYLAALQAVIFGFAVCVNASALFSLCRALALNISRLLSTRRPRSQNSDARPEIGKLPKTLVDRIPLVVYIPPPGEEGDFPKNVLGISPPPAIYSPESPAGALPKPQHRFKFSKLNREAEYPFVRLAENRAVCSICLLDFGEPPRETGWRWDSALETQNHQLVSTASTSKSPGLPEPAETVTDAERQIELHLVGERVRSQLLRLLPCGHAFHATCIDPWLTNVCGRCAICQCAIAISLEKGQ